MNFLFITDNVEIAAFIEECGVGRVFVDLEQNGKKERQFGRDTHLSRHKAEAIAPVKAALRVAKVLVRVNPLHDGSAAEVETAIGAGADYLMLPMFRRAAELATFCRIVRGRVPVVPLIETGGALDDAAEVVRIDGVAEVFVGLNDLHIDLKKAFMFQPLAEGLVDRVAEVCHRAGKPFGFGGIARLGEGLLDPELILAEHVRLGSKWVILSRTFHRGATTLAELKASGDLRAELEKLLAVVARMSRRTPTEVERDTQALRDQVAGVIARKPS